MHRLQFPFCCPGPRQAQKKERISCPYPLCCGELEMMMLGRICSISTALSLTAAMAPVRAASHTLVALGEKALSMLVLDVTVNECDYSPARTSLPISCGVQLLTPWTCSLSALHRAACCINGNANVFLIILSHQIWSNLFCLMHTHIHSETFAPRH